MTRERSLDAAAPASVGTAVADAAHDLSNACATLLGFTSLAQEAVEQGTPLASYLGEVMQAAGTAAAIAQRLRALSERLGNAERDADAVL